MEIEIKDRIEILLNHFNISQKVLAQKAGISENTISNAKKGKNTPSLHFFNSIYKAFPNINPLWLYLGTGTMFADGTRPYLRPEIKHTAEEDCYETIKNLQKEVNYLKSQIKDKEEIIALLKSKIIEPNQ